MGFKKIQFLFWLLCIPVIVLCQDNLYTSYTTAAKRAELHRKLVLNTINKHLKLPLNDSTEDQYLQAFYALQLLHYRTPWVDARINKAIDSIGTRSRNFRRALIELIFSNYSGKYKEKIWELTRQNTDTKLFAMASEYLLKYDMDSITIPKIRKQLTQFPDEDAMDIYLEILRLRLNEFVDSSKVLIEEPGFADMLSKDFLPGQTVMYSFQRRDRNYPGLVLIRTRDGYFLRDTNNRIFNIPQLARSITNLPSYFTNGNTPQGIFNMHGFDVSKSSFIGPTPNMQLSMPVEMSKRNFFPKGSEWDIQTYPSDTGWVFSDYAQMLPLMLRSYLPLYGTYYAGHAGRTEIIAHGTTVDPEYYKGQSYYPQTPTLGCLCTKELWDGKRLDSDQLRLVNALLRAGGARGYTVVLELDNKKAPVQLDELLPFIEVAESLK